MALGIDGLFSIFPNTAWAQSHIALALSIFIALIIIGGGIAIIFWIRGLREQKIEEREIIKDIPTTLNDMNTERNKFVQDLIIENKNEGYSNIFKAVIDLWMYYTGTSIETINAESVITEAISYISNPEGDNYFKRLVTNLNSGVSNIKEKIANTSELELCRLVHTFIDKNMKIEDKIIQNSSYKSLIKRLKYQREHFRSVDGSIAIDTYLDYSKGYNEFAFLMVSLEMIENIVKMFSQSANPQELEKLMAIIAIIRSYPEKSQGLMNKELAKVGETIDAYLNSKYSSMSLPHSK